MAKDNIRVYVQLNNIGEIVDVTATSKKVRVFTVSLAGTEHEQAVGKILTKAERKLLAQNLGGAA